ncbi:MAG: hypothetical protein ABGY96_28520 [bacterium]|nr:hypothetical protein [Gammaproteobacteria bacterium]
MTDQQEPVETTNDTPNHWQLLRDVLSFQVKLAMDGIRDVVLSPVSIGAALYGLAVHRDNPGKYFNQLLQFGRKTDSWINLFGASKHYPDDESSSSDAYIKKVEDLLVGEYQKGGIVKNLKEGTDGFISRIRNDKGKDE